MSFFGLQNISEMLAMTIQEKAQMLLNLKKCNEDRNSQPILPTLAEYITCVAKNLLYKTPLALFS